MKEYSGQNTLSEYSRLVKQALSTKQDILTGAPGQVVGFDADGAALAVQGWSNPNLLDNWYFLDPINQQGQTEYTLPGYLFDRWRLNINPSKVTLEDDCIKIENTSDENNWIGQRHEIEYLRQLAGKTVTLSALYKYEGAEVISSMYIGYDASDGYANIGRYEFITGEEWLLAQVTTEIPVSVISESINFAELSNFQVDTGGTLWLKAVKLELGPIQTLAHQDEDGNWVLNDPPPNKALELAKCQRCKFVIPGTDAPFAVVGVGTTFYVGSNVSLQINIPVPVFMRCKPAVIMTGDWFVRGGGKTFAFNASYVNPEILQWSKNIVTLNISGFNGFTIQANQAIELVRSNNDTSQIILDSDL